MKRKQGRELQMLQIKELFRLYELQLNQSEISRSLGIARSTVQEYIRLIDESGLRYKEVLLMSDSEIIVRIKKRVTEDRRDKNKIDFAKYHHELTRKGVTLQLLWEENRTELKSGYSTFCRLFRRWEAKNKLSMRQIHKPGERMFVDYCGMTVDVINRQTGEVTEAQVFTACLGASSYIFTEATPSQELAHWLGSHQRAFEYFGGIPRIIVPDNLKSGVTKSCRYEPLLNRAYLDFAEHYQVAIIPTRSRKPRDKAKVEKAVQDVERRILAPLRDREFYSYTELNESIKVLLKELNNKVMQEYRVSRRELFEQTDKPALRSLEPYSPFILANWKKAKVNVDYHVEVERHYYSVPYKIVHQEVWIKVSEKTIEVLHSGLRVAFHERSKVTYGFTTLPEHMPSNHRAVQGWTEKSFLEWGATVGIATTTFIQALIEKKAHPEQAFRSILGLQRLEKKYSTARIEAACKRACHFSLFSMHHVRKILEHKQDAMPLTTTESSPQQQINHSNVRGKNYFH